MCLHGQFLEKKAGFSKRRVLIKNKNHENAILDLLSAFFNKRFLCMYKAIEKKFKEEYNNPNVCRNCNVEASIKDAYCKSCLIP